MANRRGKPDNGAAGDVPYCSCGFSSGECTRIQAKARAKRVKCDSDSLITMNDGPTDLLRSLLYAQHFDKRLKEPRHANTHQLDRVLRKYAPDHPRLQYLSGEQVNGR